MKTCMCAPDCSCNHCMGLPDPAPKSVRYITAPLYNRFMARVADFLHGLARRAQGASLRYGPLYSGKVFDRPLVSGLTEEDRIASLKRYIDKHRDDDAFLESLDRGYKRGEAAVKAIQDEKARARAQYDIEQLIAKEPEKFVAKHDADDEF